MALSNNDNSNDNANNNNANNNSKHRQQPQHAQYAFETYGIVLHQTRCQDVSRADNNACAATAGTIHYVGPVASASNPTQLYAGVIWDDVTRGKHNGTVLDKTTGQLVQHFDCPHHPTAASFVKLQKLHLGGALTLDMIRQRYLDAQHPHLEAPNNRFVGATVPTNKIGGSKPIEFYGEVKLRTQQHVGVNLRHMALRRCGICRVETTDPEAWSVEQDNGTRIHAMQHVQRLDLAGNLLSDWNDVGDVLTVFGSLQELSLAANRIRDFERGVLPCVVSLVDLNLRQCHIQSLGTTLGHLGQALPALATLNLSGNPLQWKQQSDDTGMLLAQHLPNLASLDVSECQLTNEEDIQVFCRLPRLESLSLEDNPGLERLPQRQQQQQNDDEKVYFPSLKHVQLSGTNIDSWTALEVGLPAFGALESIRLRSTPLSDREGMATTRSQLVARFAQLQHINSTPVSEQERTDAQRRYVGTIAKQLAQCQTEDETERVLNENPQYRALAEHHETAAANGRRNGNTHSTTTNLMLSDSLVSVTLQSMAAQSCEREPLIRRLPSTLTIGKIKALLCRQFGLDVDLQHLVVAAGSQGVLPTVLDDDNQTLAYFGVAEGSTIYMHERNVHAPQDAQEQEAEAQLRHLELVDKQESELLDFMERQKQAQ